jgi:4-amino-4-deoxy-L-arabinose transferase
VLARPRVALALLAVLLAATLGAIGLIEPTETRYAEIAREMRVTGDWLIPRLDGIRHFHKPPLAYWAGALGMSALGENGWGARVTPWLATLLTIAFAMRAARRRLASAHVAAGRLAWVLGSMFMLVGAGRALATDPFLALAAAGFWAFAPSALAGVWLGVGFLAKGPVVLVVTVLPVLALAAWRRSRAPLAWLGPAWGWLLAAAIALPWFAWVVARTPGLAGYLVGNQVWQRYTTTTHHRGGPPEYFVVALAAGAMPWTWAVVAGLVRALRRGEPAAQAATAWLLAPLAFFSFSGSKLPAYLLPCLPAAAWLATHELSQPSRMSRRATALTLLAMAAAGWIAGGRLVARLAGLPDGASVPLPAPVHAACAAFALAALAAWRGAIERAALGVMLAWTALAVALAPYDAGLGSPRGVARVLRENRTPGEPVVEYRRFNAGLPFYLGDNVRLLEVPREDFFEDAAERSRAFVTRDSLAAWLDARPRVWLFGPGDASAALARDLGATYRVVARTRHDALGLLSR